MKVYAILSLVPFCCFLIFFNVFAAARRHEDISTTNTKQSFKHLISEDVRRPGKHSRHKQCIFKDKLYSVGQRWSPDFGKEFGGVQYCIICECVIGLKKNHKGVQRARAKVMCSNFAQQCPQPKCANPRIYPGRCCKSCSEDDEFERTIRSRHNVTKDSTTKRKRNFYANLREAESEKSASSDVDDTNRSNWTYLHLKNGTLYFFIETAGERKPRRIRFLDLNDTIHEEFSVKGNTTLRRNFKIYGSWNVSSHLRHALFANELKIAVSFSDDADEADSQLTGLIKYSAIERKFNWRKFKQNSLLATEYFEHVYGDVLRMIGDEAERPENSIEPIHTCSHNGRQYDEGDQWPNYSDRCEMCSCQRGKVVCEAETCMSINCSRAEQIRLPDQCCPICQQWLQVDSTCEFDNRKYVAGSKWNPFIPPNGFDKCITCSCHHDQNVKCERRKCPPLECSDADSKLDDLGCCRVCVGGYNTASANNTRWHLSGTLHDMPFTDLIEAQRLSERELLRAGGCRHQEQIYANGAEWNPSFGSFGPNKCIVCRCKDGVRACTAITCPAQPNCRKLVSMRSECCPVCADDRSTRKHRKSGRRP